MIYVIGHNNPDADAIISSKILADILGYKYATIEGNDIEKSDINLIRDCMDYTPVVIKKDDILNHRYILVDHNDVKQSINDEKLVIGCIDHHPKTGYDKAIIGDYCSTALFIYQLYKDKYKFNKQQKRQIFMAVLSDSKFGRSSRYQEQDKLLLKELGFEITDDYFFKYFKETELCTDSFKNNGYKYYDKYDLISTYVERLGIDGIVNYQEFVRRQNNFLGIWVDALNNKTYVFLNYKNRFITETYDFLASRGSTIMNDFIKRLRLQK